MQVAVADVEIYLEMGLDHEERKEGALPAKRPVVSGCAGMSLSMSTFAYFRLKYL